MLKPNYFDELLKQVWDANSPTLMHFKQDNYTFFPAIGLIAVLERFLPTSSRGNEFTEQLRQFNEKGVLNIYGAFLMPPLSVPVFSNRSDGQIEAWALGAYVCFSVDPIDLANAIEESRELFLIKIGLSNG